MEYELYSAQLGFQKRTGAETAIHTHIYNAPRLKFTAILDLKAAYDLVHRKELVEVLAKELEQKHGGND